MNKIDYNEQMKCDIDNMLEDCSNWDNNEAALIEAFKRGVDFQKTMSK